MTTRARAYHSAHRAMLSVRRDPSHFVDEINAAALDAGLGGEDGVYDFLYDSDQFFNRRELDEAFKERNQGSIALQMKGVGV